MPLKTDSWTVEEALTDLNDQIDDIADILPDLEPDTDRYQALVDRADSLEYRRNGLIWMRDEGDWGDFEVEFGALTAGEKAKIHREAADSATREEMTLWFVAAGSVTGPHVGDNLSETWTTLVSDVHDGFVQWAETKINELSTPGNATQRLRMSLQERQSDEG